jgi:hypothetical protein
VDKEKCSFAEIIRHTRVVGHVDRGPRISDDPLVPGLVPPAFCILLFSYAATAGIVARAIHTRGNSENVTLRAIAGAFTMMGCAAAIFSGPDAVRVFEQPVEQHPDKPL